MIDSLCFFALKCLYVINFKGQYHNFFLIVWFIKILVYSNTALFYLRTLKQENTTDNYFKTHDMVSQHFCSYSCIINADKATACCILLPYTYLMDSLLCCGFRSVLFNLWVFGDFPAIFLILISSLISLLSESVHGIVSILYNLLKCA